MKKLYVVDTNVLAVANGAAEHMSMDSKLKAGKWLAEALRSKFFGFDTARAVENEYARHANRSGQPGIGDAFFRQAIATSRVRYLDIGAGLHEINSKLPASLRDFDEDDRKWIALYVVGGAEAIVNASDSDYMERKEDLEAEKIRVLELCREDVRVKRPK